MPNMETAVNFLMDGQPLIGEQVVFLDKASSVCSPQRLLARLPLARLVTVDRYPFRRESSLSWARTPAWIPQSHRR